MIKVPKTIHGHPVEHIRTPQGAVHVSDREHPGKTICGTVITPKIVTYKFMWMMGQGPKAKIKIIPTCQKCLKIVLARLKQGASE